MSTFKTVWTHHPAPPVEPCILEPSVTDPSQAIDVKGMIQQVLAGMVQPIPPKMYYDYMGAMSVLEVPKVTNPQGLNDLMKQIKDLKAEYAQQVEHPPVVNEITPGGTPLPKVPAEPDPQPLT